MSTPAENMKSSGSPNAKVKAREKEKRQKSAAKPQVERLKTVVRRLPPNLPEDIFWQSVQQWVTEETVQWKAYYQGKFRNRLNKENIQSRAYIAFKNEQQLSTFSRDYDGHVFRDKAGNESIAVVEFAPYQKIPSEKKKVDSRAGTIEKDEDYISFLKSLQEGASKIVEGETIETLIAASQPPPQPTTTPLLEALKAEKSAQKDKESILRNHAHYKDPSVTAAAKKEDKKKAAAGGAAKPVPTEQPLSKKAKKAAAKAAQQQAQPQQPAASTSTTEAKAPAPVSNAQGQAKQTQAAQTSRPVKAPRAPRERPAKSSPAPAPSTSATPSAATPSAQSGADASATTSSDAAAASSSRRRPVLGLGSRQFEAALSGAGVSGRPSRRGQAQDKDREKDKDKDKNAGDAQSASGEAAGKSKEDRRAAQATRSAPAPPTILTRDAGTATPKILTRDGAAGGTATPAVDGVAQEEAPGGPSNGGRSGRRGRGRGRGGLRGVP